MNVFVITQAYDCEGECPIGVAASLETAKAIATQNAVKCGYSPGEWATTRSGAHELQFGSTQYVIREEQVQETHP
jgi:hypothetical protein